MEHIVVKAFRFLTEDELAAAQMIMDSKPLAEQKNIRTTMDLPNVKLRPTELNNKRRMIGVTIGGVEAMISSRDFIAVLREQQWDITDVKVK